MSAASQDPAGAFDPTLPLATARTPPAWWYSSPERAALERRAVLAANWQVVAHRDEIEAPGSYLAGCSGGEPWVLVRDGEGRLGAFSNVCRHNGTQVAQGAGRAERLVCRYHGWAYHLDGRLAKAPRIAGVKDFDRSVFGLQPLPVQELGPLVFVNVDGAAPALELGDLAERLTAAGWEGLERRERRSYHLSCNWKVFVDNYLDGGYHVPFLHPDLAGELALGDYRTELFARHSVQSVPSSAEAGERLGSEALYAWIHPNLMINRYGPMMDINVVVPTGPQSCRVDFDWYFEPDRGEDFIQESIRASEQVQEEDIVISESLQVGMGSMHFRPGLYAPDVEQGKYHFHRLVHADVAAAG